MILNFDRKFDNVKAPLNPQVACQNVPEFFNLDQQIPEKA
jgi:hypothetical protein